MMIICEFDKKRKEKFRIIHILTPKIIEYSEIIVLKMRFSFLFVGVK